MDNDVIEYNGELHERLCNCNSEWGQGGYHGEGYASEDDNIRCYDLENEPHYGQCFACRYDYWIDVSKPLTEEQV